MDHCKCNSVKSESKYNFVIWNKCVNVVCKMAVILSGPKCVKNMPLPSGGRVVSLTDCVPDDVTANRLRQANYLVGVMCSGKRPFLRFHGAQCCWLCDQRHARPYQTSRNSVTKQLVFLGYRRDTGLKPSHEKFNLISDRVLGILTAMVETHGPSNSSTNMSCY